MATITTISSTDKVGDSRTVINTNFSNINSELAGAFKISSNDSDDITEGSSNLFMTTAERSKLSGIEASADVTDTANVTSAGAFMISSNDSDDITEGSTNLFFSSAEQTKLSGIETGAEVNTVNSDPTGVTGADQVINQMSLTTSEYAAIGAPDSATIYYVTDA